MRHSDFKRTNASTSLHLQPARQSAKGNVTINHPENKHSKENPSFSIVSISSWAYQRVTKKNKKTHIPRLITSKPPQTSITWAPWPKNRNKNHPALAPSFEPLNHLANSDFEVAWVHSWDKAHQDQVWSRHIQFICCFIRSWFASMDAQGSPKMAGWLQNSHSKQEYLVYFGLLAEGLKTSPPLGGENRIETSNLSQRNISTSTSHIICQPLSPSQPKHEPNNRCLRTLMPSSHMTSSKKFWPSKRTMFLGGNIVVICLLLLLSLLLLVVVLLLVAVSQEMSGYLLSTISLLTGQVYAKPSCAVLRSPVSMEQIQSNPTQSL